MQEPESWAASLPRVPVTIASTVMNGVNLSCLFLQDAEESGLAESVHSAVKPFADLDLFVANEAYSTQQVGTASTSAV